MLHPSKFFEWCAIRTGIDVFEIFDEELRQKLINIHPRNFIKTKITHPVYKVTVSYETGKGNCKTSKKYMILDSPSESEYNDFWADMFVRDYEANNKEVIKNIQILSVQFIGGAVLQIG